MGVEHAGVETGVVARGVGVYLAADGVHALGELGGGVLGGALEEHMLDEMALPASEYFSYLEPAPTQMPMEAERTASMCS